MKEYRCERCFKTFPAHQGMSCFKDFTGNKEGCLEDVIAKKTSGKGGQKKNKTESAVRCTHLDSGAVGNCSETRSQHKNKQIAFRRMAETQEFRDWLKIENARAMGHYKNLDEKVDVEMKRVLIEVQKDGKWVREV